LAGSRQQYDAGTLRRPHRQRSTPSLGLQQRSLLRTQRNGWGNSHRQRLLIIRRAPIDKGC
jgi:hypothetical protein